MPATAPLSTQPITTTFAGHGPDETGLRRITFHGLGTKCMLQYAPEQSGPALAFEQEVLGWMHAFEARYSRFRADSLVSQINAAAGLHWVEVDEDMENLLGLCDTLNFVTRGVLDPTSLPLIRLWDYSRRPAVIPTPSQIAAARALVGWSKVQRAHGRIFLPQPGMCLDFGGFGKEYAVDRVAQIATEHGLSNVLVDFGHDLRALGQPPQRPCWHVGLEDPKKPGASAGSVGISGQGVASSGDYLRCFVVDGRRYGHIIDPRTGWPVANGCLQATVIANTCLHAGVVSTTAFVLGLTEGIAFMQSFPGVEGVMSTANTRAQTRGFFKYVVS